MKYAIKGGIFAGIMQLILFILPIIINKLAYIDIPRMGGIVAIILGIVAIIFTIIIFICHIPTVLVLRLLDTFVRIPRDDVYGGYAAPSHLFNLSGDWGVPTNNGWIFSSIVIILIGTLIGYIYGKIKGKNNL